MNWMDAEELAVAVLGLPEESDSDIIENGIDDKFDCSMETFEKIADALIPLTIPAKAALSGELFQGFVRNGAFIVKARAKQSESTAPETSTVAPSHSPDGSPERVAQGVPDDTARLEWLAKRWSAINFDYGDEESAKDRRSVIIFDIPQGSSWSFSFNKDSLPQRLRESIDRAMLAPSAEVLTGQQGDEKKSS